jgi:SSS family solute:Na+ symporter
LRLGSVFWRSADGRWALGNVAGRSFGAPLVFLLMAGEIYTTFTFIGGSDFAYGRGGPVYYISS